MTEAARERRRRLDHERYMRSREERKASQRSYYRKNRDELLDKVRQRRLGIYVRPTPTEADVAACRERKLVRDRAYYHAHREAILERRRLRKLKADNVVAFSDTKR